MRLPILCAIGVISLATCSREDHAAAPIHAAPIPATPSNEASQDAPRIIWSKTHTDIQFKHLYDWMRSHGVEPAVAMIPNADGSYEADILNGLNPDELKAMLQFLDSDPIYADWKPLPEAKAPCKLHIGHGKVELLAR